MYANTQTADYYEYLQISPNADTETIEKVFRLLAKKYHPDNPSSGSPEKFSRILNAYQVLTDPEKRAAYDLTYPEIQKRKWKFHVSISSDSKEDEQKIRHTILAALYTTRKKNVKEPGVGACHLEQMLGFPEEVMEFEMWYLKEKGWLSRTDTGKFAITVDGVDMVEKNRVVSNHVRMIPMLEPMNENWEKV